MTKIDIKPLSINDAFTGDRFKTKEYRTYRNTLLWLLPKDLEVGKERLKLTLKVGYSSSRSDIDNFVKPFVDVLQERYKFNDSQIYELHVTKEVVAEGKTFIDFKIEKLSN